MAVNTRSRRASALNFRVRKTRRPMPEPNGGDAGTAAERAHLLNMYSGLSSTLSETWPLVPLPKPDGVNPIEIRRAFQAIKVNLELMHEHIMALHDAVF